MPALRLDETVGRGPTWEDYVATVKWKLAVKRAGVYLLSVRDMRLAMLFLHYKYR